MDIPTCPLKSMSCPLMSISVHHQSRLEPLISLFPNYSLSYLCPSSVVNKKRPFVDEPVIVIQVFLLPVFPLPLAVPVVLPLPVVLPVASPALPFALMPQALARSHFLHQPVFEQQ